ncbi:MAG: GH116 family glycosyl-hydrolase [bacterium]|nr:GH116 family glycosyl-hydrolase [bacterium]
MNLVKGIIIGNSNIYTIVEEVTGTKHQALFQGERFGRDFCYHLVDLPNGSYTVEFGFAELYFTEPGKRIFDVIIQGKPVLKNLDVFAVVGKHKALVKQFKTEVTNHTLDIELKARIDNAKVNYLRLIKGNKKYDLDCASILKLATPPKAQLNPKTGVIWNSEQELPWKTGVPFGGIGTGKFELFTNGGFGNITFNNNWDRPLPYLRGSFLGLYTDDGKKKTAKLLRVKQPYDIVQEYTNVETVKEIEYLGLFPRAELKFKDRTLPVNVSLHTYSFLIPQDNLNSCLPTAIFSFNLTNPTNKKIDTSLIFSFENCLGRGGSKNENEQWDEVTTNSQEPIEFKKMTGLLFKTDQNYKTNRQNAVGEYLLATEKKKDVEITSCPNWSADEDTISFWQKFGETGEIKNSEVRSQKSEKAKPAGAISAKVSLKKKETKTIDFVFCWYMPHHITKKDNRDNGHYYQTQFADIKSIAEYAYTHRQEFLEKTKEWQDLVLDSNLPFWLKLKLINSVFPMVTNTIYTKDGQFAVQESPIDMGGALGTMDQRMASHAFMTMFYPELDKSELELFAKCQQPDGRITHFDGNIHEIIGDPNVGYGITDWPDLSCSFIMQVFKQYRWTGDTNFFNRMAPHIQRALAWLESADKDGDSVPEGGSTYDYEKPFPGAFIYSASCYLGALKTGIEVARINGDTALQKKYKTRFTLVQKKVIELLWNGKYFIKQYNPKTGEKNPNSFIAQFAGDWLAQLSGLGNTLPKSYIQTGLENIIKMHLNKFKPVPPMEVTPDGKCATRHCFIIQHEPYLGCEAIYEGFVDAGLDVIKRVYDVAWELNKSPWNQSLNYLAPDGQQGFLVTYMTCPATWHVLNALAGATLDVPNQTLHLCPRVEANPKSEIRDPKLNLKIPIFFSKFWAWLDFDSVKGIAKLKVIKTFGTPIKIKQILIREPDGKEKLLKLKSAVSMQPGKSVTLNTQQ